MLRCTLHTLHAAPRRAAVRALHAAPRRHAALPAWRLWRLVRAVLFMLRRGVLLSGRGRCGAWCAPCCSYCAAACCHPGASWPWTSASSSAAERSPARPSGASNTPFSATAESHHSCRDETRMLPVRCTVLLGRKRDVDASGRLTTRWRSCWRRRRIGDVGRVEKGSRWCVAASVIRRHAQNARGEERLQNTPTRRGFRCFLGVSPVKTGLPNGPLVISRVFDLGRENTR